ncbi:MAG: FHA domain-containing protein [Deltaproteobacteria bacterium]|nr:FHA domain-containing protein [Deltaproteobacteria bacterium]
MAINDPRLSRNRAEIIQEGNRLVLCDKHSSNGSRINGDRVMRQVLLYSSEPLKFVIISVKSDFNPF